VYEFFEFTITKKEGLCRSEDS